MNDAAEITLQLATEDHQRLIVEANRRGVSAEALARTLVHAGLAGRTDMSAEQGRQAGTSALAGLAALRAVLPDAGPVDVVRLVKEGREDLNRRAMP